MENSKHLADRFREVLLNGTWIANTNYSDQLSDVSWKQANTKIGSLNTIAILTYHINYYVAGVLNLFENGLLEIRDKYSFDAPEIKSEEDWDKRVSDMRFNAEKLADHIERLPIEKLEEVFVDEKYGNYRRNIEGLIEHSYYHLGQISLIKKLVKEKENV